MGAEIPKGWEPPHKIVGGEDNFELYAIFLYDQVVAAMCARTRNFDLPIAADADKYIKQKAIIIENMEQRGVYFHKPHGSVFMDYKIMREIASQKEDWENIKSQFSPEMSTEEAMRLARIIVANWNWAQENSRNNRNI